MSTTTRTISAPPDAVWAVLADGWLYPLWVVGATRMRDVDDSWPDPGARLHHSVGAWPVVIDDDTEVLASEPEQLLRLRAKAWPLGEAEVTITLSPSALGTDVTLEEHILEGPGRLIPEMLEDLAVTWRNQESLLRLGLVVEGRHQGTGPGDASP